MKSIEAFPWPLWSLSLPVKRFRAKGFENRSREREMRKEGGGVEDKVAKKVN